MPEFSHTLSLWVHPETRSSWLPNLVFAPSPHVAVLQLERPPYGTGTLTGVPTQSSFPHHRGRNDLRRERRIDSELRPGIGFADWVSNKLRAHFDRKDRVRSQEQLRLSCRLGQKIVAELHEGMRKSSDSSKTRREIVRPTEPESGIRARTFSQNPSDLSVPVGVR